MSTWGDLIKSSLIELTVLEGGEDPETHEVEEGLNRLKYLIGQWEIDGLFAPGDKHLSLTFENPAKMRVVVGPADDDLDVDIEVSPAPFRIEIIRYQNAGSESGYLLNAVSSTYYESVQSQRSNHPSVYYYEKAHPHSYIWLDRFPLPGDKLQITASGTLNDKSFEATDEHDLPVGYERMIITNLALELASSYGVSNQLTLATIAKKAKDANNIILKRNREPFTARLPRGIVNAGTRGGFLTGGYRRHY